MKLNELLYYFWRNKIFIFISLSVFAVSIVIYSIYLPNTYKSYALVAPVKKSETPQISSSLSGLGSVLGMGNISSVLGGSVVNDKDIAISTLKSRSFFEDILDDELMINLFATKSYDRSLKKSIIDPKIYDSESNTWTREESGPYFSKVPTREEAFIEFHKNYKIVENKRNFLVEITYESKNPEISKRILIKTIDMLNTYLKEKDRKEALDSIAFLKKQVESERIVEIQNSLNMLITQNIQKAMFAEIRKDYAYEYITYPVVPELKSGPSRAIICVIGFFGFSLLIFTIFTIRFYFEESDPR